jgi:ATP-binding cassette, subfamily B, bacterial
MSAAAPPPRPTTLRLTRVVRSPDDEEIDRRPLEWGLIRRLFGFARPYRASCVALAILTVVRSAQLPLLVWAIGAVIGGPISRSDWPGTLWGAGGFLALAFATTVTFHFRQRLALQFGEEVVHDLRLALFAHLLRLKLGFFTTTKIGRIIGRMTSDVESVRIGVQDVLFVSIVQAGQMLVAAGLMLWYDWMLFSVVLVLAPALFVLNRFFRVAMSRATREVQESFSRVTATLAESVNGIRVTQGFVRQDVNAGLFRSLIVDHARNNMNVARTSAVFVTLLDFNSQMFIAVLLVLGGWQALHHQVGVREIIMFFFLAGTFFGPIQALGNQYAQALTAMAGAERLFRLLDTAPEWEDRADARPLGVIKGRVEFRNLSFGYEPGRLVLHDLDFTAEPGETIALVGHTGCGKSTVINLIAKFYLPGAGELLIDGTEIRAITSDSLHHQLGIVTQSNFLFSGTVMENIRVGRPAASDSEVIEAARRLDTLDLFATMPDGFNTRVGEKGSGLSLGQKQLICFTRAMLADPRILILDEATSSVDAMTEARLQRSLATLLKGRTSFVVAHRLSTIRHANQVLVLEHGRIIERGTHFQLLVRGGVYADLYRQFSIANDAG